MKTLLASAFCALIALGYVLGLSHVQMTPEARAAETAFAAQTATTQAPLLWHADAPTSTAQVTATMVKNETGYNVTYSYVKTVTTVSRAKGSVQLTPDFIETDQE